MLTIPQILALGPVMPVIVIDNSDQAVPLAEALLEGGIRTIEITLRTPAALDAISAVASHCPDITIGAGTVNRAELAHQARDAGAAFAVSPGTTQDVISGCRAAALPLLPGAATVSEMMALQDEGFSAVKFFPANASGGTAFIKALASPSRGDCLSDRRHHTGHRTRLACPVQCAMCRWQLGRLAGGHRRW